MSHSREHKKTINKLRRKYAAKNGVLHPCLLDMIFLSEKSRRIMTRARRKQLNLREVPCA